MSNSIPDCLCEIGRNLRFDLPHSEDFFELIVILLNPHAKCNTGGLEKPSISFDKTSNKFYELAPWADFCAIWRTSLRILACKTVCRTITARTKQRKQNA